MNLKKRLSYSLITHLLYKFSFIISPIILFPTIINYLNVNIFEFWIITNSILIFIFANDFGIGMSKLMELNKYLKININSFKIKINTILNFKIILYSIYLIIITLVIFHFDIQIIQPLFIIAIVYQTINHLSIVLSHALWSSGKNWLIYLINGFCQIFEIILFLLLLFIFKADVYSFISFPLLSIIRAIILLIVVTKINLFKYGIDFDIKFLFSKASGILGFIFETLASNTKLHLLRFLLGLVLSGFKFTQITILFTFANLSKNICASISQIIFPELNQIRDDKEKFNAYSLEYIRLGFFFNLIICIIFIIFGEKIINLWMSNNDFFEKDLFYLIIFIVFFQNINELISYIFQSINKHLVYYTIYIVFLTSSLVIFFVTKSLITLLYVYLTVEVIMIFINLYLLKKIIKLKNLIDIFALSKFFVTIRKYLDF
tara:strand:+ start:120 stop:1415 length:1296 start_codon:yes stop_codon:yes gene_type:complete